MPAFLGFPRPVFFLAINAPVFFTIYQFKYMGQLLLNRSYTPGIFALYYIDNLLGHMHMLFFCNSPVFNDINRNVRINKSQYIKIYICCIFDFNNIFFPGKLSINLKST